MAQNPKTKKRRAPKVDVFGEKMTRRANILRGVTIGVVFVVVAALILTLGPVSQLFV